MEVPDIPLSYSWTGAIKSVTPTAFITPARSRHTKLKGENLLIKSSMAAVQPFSLDMTSVFPRKDSRLL